MHEFFVRFLRFNEAANQLYIDAILKAQPKSERVPKILCHIFNAQRIWNARLAGDSSPTNVWEIHPSEQWSDINREHAARSLAFARPESVMRIVDYKDLRGAPHRRTVADILTHIVNHSTYHRGQ